MNRTLRAIIAVAFVVVIVFCGISICQNIGKGMRADITDQKIYTLSDGTKAILGKLHQPIKMKLYYARTAAMKGPDNIRFFNNYYYFVKALLEEYQKASGGKVELQIIDPRPFGDDESDALRYGIKKFPISEEENFFFGLVVQTQFGVTKAIPFFSPDRQNFVEYDISYLIDTAIARQKKRIGVLSSLPVMGDDVSGYMAQMMQMQGQKPKAAWTIIEQLREQYDVSTVAADANEIKDIDMLLVVHPKELKEQTQFAIDQYVLGGGRAIILTDPFCISDRPQQNQMQMYQQPKTDSELNRLTSAWGVEMPANTFAGDRSLAIVASMTQNASPEKIIAFLGLTRDCFNPESVITSNLNDVRMLFAGVLKPVNDPNIGTKLTPIIHTTNRGNSWSVSSPYELMMPDPGQMMKNFSDGVSAVNMGYLITGRFKSAFPNGIEVDAKSADANAPAKQKLTGLKVAKSDDCAVIVIADVDFISDILAYQQSFFGAAVVGDNAALLMNSIDDLAGSSELIAIRSRGNFRRPFTKVDAIEADAEKASSEEEGRINAQIESFQQELNTVVSNAKGGDEELIGKSILDKKKDLEIKIREAQGKLRHVKADKRKNIEDLGNKLRNFNMLAAPSAILMLAVVLGVRRNARRRHYISHASDS